MKGWIVMLIVVLLCSSVGRTDSPADPTPHVKILVGRLVPGTGKRSEWETVGEWVVFKFTRPDGNMYRVEVTVDDKQRLQFWSGTDGASGGTGGTIAQSIRFGGCMNQATLELVPADEQVAPAK
jgi:hypothetical protein